MLSLALHTGLYTAQWLMYEMLSPALRTGLSTAQWLSVENAGSDSTVIHLCTEMDLVHLLVACRLVSLWATNPEVPFTVASHCRSWSCCDWPCSYRFPDSGTSGCSKVHHNSHLVMLHQLTVNTAVLHLLVLKSQCGQVSGTTGDVHVCLLQRSP